MLVSAQRVRKANSGREGVNVSLWKHHEPVPRTDDAKIDLEFISTLSPGRYEAEHVELAPGGNPVLAYLDIATEDAAPRALVERALATFAQTIGDPRPAWVFDTDPKIAVRFGGALHYFLTQNPRAAFDELSRHSLDLLAHPTKPKWIEGEPLDVRLRREANRSSFSLTGGSGKRVSALGGQPFGIAISIEHGVWEDFAASFGEVFPHIVPTLTGLRLEDLPALGGVRVLQDPGGQVLWRWPTPPGADTSKVIVRNFTGHSGVRSMTPEGKLLEEHPPESRRFFGGAGGIMTHDDEKPLESRPFVPKDLPPPRPNVKILLRPEVYRYCRDELTLDRDDLTDGNPVRTASNET